MPFIVVAFQSNGVPQTGLSPTIEIRRLSDNGLEVTGGAMTHVGEGSYSFNFNSGAGYDEEEDYAWRADGGGGLSDTDRYKFGVNPIPLPDDDNHSIRLTAAGLEDNAVDASAIATDAIDNDAIAAGAITVTEAPNLDAAVSSRATQADILSDATPFAGANIDVAISSRESEASAAARAAADIAEHDVTQATQAVHTAALVAINADTDDIQTRLPAALVGGRMNSDVGNIQAGAVDAAAIAADAIDADALATDAVNEIVDQTWREILADHSGVTGSTAEALAGANAVQYRVEQAWTRSITSPAGSRIRGIFALHVDGQFTAMPGAARLAITIRDEAGTVIDSVTDIAPNSEGYFSHEFDPWTLVQGTVDISIATITSSGVGPGTHVSAIVIAWPDFVATV